jgi:hypothetical protein
VKLPRRIFLMLSFTAVIVAACMALNYVLNPYGAWRIALIDPVFSRIKDERVQVPYLLRATEPETLLVGSSRIMVGMRIEQGYRDGVLNAGLRNATIPQISRIIDLALANPRLKRIVWGVDFFAFNRGWDQKDPILDARMAGSGEATLEDTLLSLDALGDSYDQLMRAVRGRGRLPSTRTASVPWPMGLICAKLDDRANRDLTTTTHRLLIAQLAYNRYADFHFSSDLFRRFLDTVNRARAHHVEVIILLPPMSQYDLELLRQSGQWDSFQNFKRMLASIGPFWNFSGYNELSRRDDLFSDMIHLKTPAGQLVLRIVLGLDRSPCSERARVIWQSGVRVDAQSIDSELARQEAMREAAMTRDSRYSRAVAEAIHLPVLAP